MPEDKKAVAITIRIPADQHARLKAAFWKTAPKHQQSFNTWVCELLAAGLAKKA